MDDLPPPPPPTLIRSGREGQYVVLQGTRYYIRKNENNSDMITFQGDEYYLQYDPETNQRYIIRNGTRINFTTQGGSKRKRSKRKRTRKYKK
jgi:hypothetical protein